MPILHSCGVELGFETVIEANQTGCVCIIELKEGWRGEDWDPR